jgi:HSF-type DNA-binding
MHFAKGCYDGVVESYATHPSCGSTFGNALTGPQVKPIGAFHDTQYHGDGSKSGQTDNHLHRQVVVHHYRDRAQEEPNSCARRYDGAALFPVKLHKVLNAVQAEGLDHIVSWVSHGRCFRIHDAEAFVERVMPK